MMAFNTLCLVSKGDDLLPDFRRYQNCHNFKALYPIVCSAALAAVDMVGPAPHLQWIQGVFSTFLGSVVANQRQCVQNACSKKLD